MEDSSNDHQNSKHEEEPTCFLYVSRAISSHSQDTADDLSKATLIEAIRALEPSGNWSVYQTPRGLIATFTLEADAEKLIQHGSLNYIFQSPVQVAQFSAQDSRYRQSVFLRDVPWAIPLEDISSALAKQGTPAAKIERYRQYVRVELTDANHYEVLLRQGLDFFGAARFTALPEQANFSRGASGTNPGPQQPLIQPGGQAVEGLNVQQPDGILQCYRCQGFWHVAANCRHLPRCVRCGEPHSVGFCHRPRNNPICCHCSGPHHAGYKQCPVKLQLQNATPMSITLSTSNQGQSSPSCSRKSSNSQNQTLNEQS
ncbi:uncharacterized protein [Chelonus insularis]|uniref:uncharacterized protein n=1 Tax=Chelonus insularis TaxID=460826 RepID=UPI00158CC653|nr:uncharacterized protein LOC118073911 [Chelonus insularis]